MTIDTDSLNQTIYFFTGMLSAVVTAYGAMRASNKTLIPVQKIEAARAKIQALKDSNASLQEVTDITGNISLVELADIICMAQEFGLDGFTAAEAQALGNRIVEAVKSKD